MKIHARKAATKRIWHHFMHAGLMPDAGGNWRPRGQYRSDSMVANFHPQARGIGKTKGKK